MGDNPWRFAKKNVDLINPMSDYQPSNERAKTNASADSTSTHGEGLSRPAVSPMPLQRVGIKKASLPAANAVIQMVKPDIYDPAAFADPATVLSAKYPGVAIREEPGSQGIDGDPDVKLIKVLATEAGRDNLMTEFLKKQTHWQTELDKHKTAYEADSSNGEAQTKMNEASGKLGKIKELVDNKAFWEITDVTSAANWYKAHTLLLSKAGFSPKETRVKAAAVPPGVKAAAPHDFHRDSGYLQVTPSGTVPAVLNGPKSAGWVRGHSGIDNFAHRFVEHIHVDKDDHENRFEIYNADKPAVDAAKSFGATNKDRLMDPGGPGTAAMANAEGISAAASLTSAIKKATPPKKVAAAAAGGGGDG
jgi:hypothetical protein